MGTGTTVDQDGVVAANTGICRKHQLSHCPNEDGGKALSQRHIRILPQGTKGTYKIYTCMYGIRVKNGIMENGELKGGGPGGGGDFRLGGEVAMVT